MRTKFFLFAVLLGACAVHRPAPVAEPAPNVISHEERKGVAEGLILARGMTNIQCLPDADVPDAGKCSVCRSGELVCYACESRSIGCNAGDQI